jgi:HNH endonuclease
MLFVPSTSVNRWRGMLSERHRQKMVYTPEGHLLWIGGLANGYPAVKRGRDTLYLKRMVWAEIHGSVPEGAVVISTCGERTCVEPAHLGLSTAGRYASVRDALGRYAGDPEDGD